MTGKSSTIRWRMTWALASLMAACGTVSAQDAAYPTKNVTFVVAYTP